VDAFWQRFEPLWERELLRSGTRQRRRATRLHPAEILTILILFQQLGYRTFKGFYTQHVQNAVRQEFPRQVGYRRNSSAAHTRLELTYPDTQQDARQDGSSNRGTARAAAPATESPHPTPVCWRQNVIGLPLTFTQAIEKVSGIKAVFMSYSALDQLRRRCHRQNVSQLQERG
jgi:hypothetical protein